MDTGATARLLLAFQLVTRVLQLAASIVVVRSLAPAGLGLTTLSLSIAQIANTLTDAGVGAMLLRQKDQPEPHAYAAARTFNVVASAAFGLPAAAVVATVADLPPGGGLLVFATAGDVLLSGLQLPANVQLDREQRYRTSAVIDIVQMLSYYAVALPLIVIRHDVVGVAIGTLVSEGLRTVLLNRAAGMIPTLTRRYDIVKRQLRDARWLQADLAVQTGVSFSISALTARIGLTGVGMYGVAVRLCEPALQVAAVLQQLVYPQLARVRAGLERVRWSETAIAGFSLVATAASLPIVANAHWVVDFIAGHRYERAAQAVPLVAVTVCVLSVVTHTAVAALTAERGGKPVAGAKLGTLVSVWPATLIASSLFGVAGLAGGFAIAYTVEATLLLIALSSAFGRVPRLRVPIFCALVVLLAAYVPPGTVTHPSLWTVVLRTAAAEVVLLAGMRMIDWEPVKRIWGLVWTLRPWARTRSSAALSEPSPVVGRLEP